jgi:hypothetical protein
LNILLVIKQCFGLRADFLEICKQWKTDMTSGASKCEESVKVKVTEDSCARMSKLHVRINGIMRWHNGETELAQDYNF